jgi:hypothetical protein
MEELHNKTSYELYMNTNRLGQMIIHNILLKVRDEILEKIVKDYKLSAHKKYELYRDFGGDDNIRLVVAQNIEEDKEIGIENLRLKLGL